jgi:calcineurin-like phosphoesterase
MTGPYDSVIGMRTENVLEKFVTKRPKSFEVASNNVWLSAICITIDTRTGQAKEIFPVRRKL